MEYIFIPYKIFLFSAWSPWMAACGIGGLQFEGLKYLLSDKLIYFLSPWLDLSLFMISRIFMSLLIKSVSIVVSYFTSYVLFVYTVSIIFVLFFLHQWKCFFLSRWQKMPWLLVFQCLISVFTYCDAFFWLISYWQFVKVMFFFCFVISKDALAQRT